jgi:hypothetical protein
MNIRESPVVFALKNAVNMKFIDQTKNKEGQEEEKRKGEEEGEREGCPTPSPGQRALLLRGWHCTGRDST